MTFTLWLFNIAMENGPFIDDCPIKTSIYFRVFPMAMLNNQMVICPRFIKFDQLSQVDVPAQHLVADQMIKRAKA